MFGWLQGTTEDTDILGGNFRQRLVDSHSTVRNLTDAVKFLLGLHDNIARPFLQKKSFKFIIMITNDAPPFEFLKWICVSSIVRNCSLLIKC
jgi:hypothetical protein